MTTTQGEASDGHPEYFCVQCGREQDWGEGNCIKCGSMYLAHIRVYPVFSGKDGAFNAMQLSDDYHMQTAMKRVDEAFEGILYEFARLHRKEREEAERSEPVERETPRVAPRGIERESPWK